jgi:hypothetical protein
MVSTLQPVRLDNAPMVINGGGTAIQYPHRVEERYPLNL